jgi:hypothetical protein
MSTLAHEMCHHQQEHFGAKAGTLSKRKSSYHDKEWAAMMKSIGLQPSSTSMVGGKETGQKMSHYILKGGAFSRSYERLAATGWKLNWQSTPRSNAERARKNKSIFDCPICDCTITGNPHTDQVCRPCTLNLAADNPELSAVLEALFKKTRMRIREPAANNQAAPLAEPEAITSYEPTPEPEPIKRKPGRPGRPKGSKNKPKLAA